MGEGHAETVLVAATREGANDEALAADFQPEGTAWLQEAKCW